MHRLAGKTYGSTGVASILGRLMGSLKATVERAAWMLADEVVVETSAVAEELSDLRPRKPMSVIPHGLAILTEPYNGGAAADPVELLYVGTPGIRKRTHLLPGILDRVRQASPEARLRIVGFDADGDANLLSEAELLDVLGSIDFVGTVRAEEVLPFYRSARVLILPSAYEGLPMVLLEAMREGVVPVATNVSGHPDAIDDGVNGYLVELDDVEAMAERCISLLRDDLLLAGMSDRARTTVAERFSLEVELQAHLSLYRDLV